MTLLTAQAMNQSRAPLHPARPLRAAGRGRSCAIFLFIALLVANAFAAESDPTISFLLKRVQSDPMDSVAHNRLASACVQRMRETGDLGYLDRAKVAAR